MGAVGKSEINNILAIISYQCNILTYVCANYITLLLITFGYKTR